MTKLNFPDVRQPDSPRELWEGEAEALAGAAEAGRRAAAWMRALPVPETGGRPERWVVGELADAVERAMSALEPGDCDRVGPDCVAVDGGVGVDAAAVGRAAGCRATRERGQG
ncbi:hypothetical protein OG582_40100 (plasmid) [Streptomyces anulatus]|uniref:hypothetical protein n=1 Tax=Streptomyces anulatus TaxID=1892 RepID=UPI002F911479|nr:hypothetical protein OHA54_00280 [Streptomyces anulatus]WTE01043.1 hypothetical protein OH765_00280 [Streptomyces anulatus]